jgi:hypothetical protein
MSARLIIEQIGRTTADGKIEAIKFKEGANAIVGPQNTGKSTWLRMLDFLMGESESARENFDEVIVQKYRAISALLRFGSEVVELERQWSEDGGRSQIRLNGDRLNADGVQECFLDRLGIPSCPINWPSSVISKIKCGRSRRTRTKEKKFSLPCPRRPW